MKALQEINDRLRSLLIAEFDRRVALASKRLPTQCVHNHRQRLDVRKRIEDEPNPGYNRVDRVHLPVVSEIGLCLLGAESPEDWQGTICEDPIDAQRCPTFLPLETKEQLIENFEQDVKSPEWLREHLPEAYGLLWVLDTSEVPVLPWWKRLWYRFLRIQVEPLRSNFDVIALLPSVTSRETDDGVHGS